MPWFFEFKWFKKKQDSPHLWGLILWFRNSLFSYKWTLDKLDFREARLQGLVGFLVLFQAHSFRMCVGCVLLANRVGSPSSFLWSWLWLALAHSWLWCSHTLVVLSKDCILWLWYQGFQMAMLQESHLAWDPNCTSPLNYPWALELGNWGGVQGVKNWRHKALGRKTGAIWSKSTVLNTKPAQCLF